MSVALYPLASKGSTNQLHFILFSILSLPHSACRGRPINVCLIAGGLDQLPEWAHQTWGSVFGMIFQISNWFLRGDLLLLLAD